jgi:hypothetical protein
MSTKISIVMLRNGNKTNVGVPKRQVWSRIDSNNVEWYQVMSGSIKRNQLVSNSIRYAQLVSGKLRCDACDTQIMT